MSLKYPHAVNPSLPHLFTFFSGPFDSLFDFFCLSESLELQVGLKGKTIAISDSKYNT